MRSVLRRGFATASAEVLVGKDKDFMVHTYARQPVVFSHGRGVHLYDMGGREYLDFYSGIAVTALGHGDAELVAAVADQASRLIHVSNLFYNAEAGGLAEKLVGHAASFARRVFFCNSGTEAAEGAFKFARKWGHSHSDDKINVVAFHGGFHGRTMGALSCTPNPKYQKPFLPLVPGVTHIPVNDTAAARAAIDDRTCAVFIEPIQGEGGVNVVADSFLHELRELCTRHNALLMFDEVQCGLGRTGRLWAHDWLPSNVRPDVMTLAKALGNGIPVGAIVVNEKVGNLIVPGDHGSTFAAQPLACRAGHVVLDRVSQPAFLGHVHAMGTLLRDQLLALRNPAIREVRGRGLIVGVVVDTKALNMPDVNPILERARDRGLLIINAGPTVLRLLPPLIIDHTHVTRAVSIIDECLRTPL